MRNSVLILLACVSLTAHGKTQLWANVKPMWFAHNDRVYFRNQEQPQEVAKKPKEIPLNLIMELNNVYNVTEFINNFIDYESYKNVTGDDLITNRFGEAEQRKNIAVAKAAKCMPALTVVPLNISNDTALLYYPSCTRVERCGGCCLHSLLNCQPTETEIINYEVYISEYTGAKQMQMKDRKVVSVERHIKCKCGCIVKAEDCNQLQEYRNTECRCVCLNVDEEQKCLAENDTKLWDPQSCSCGCRDIKECSTGYFFDQNICSCAQVPNRNPSNLRLRSRRGETFNKNIRITSEEQSLSPYNRK